MIKREFQKSKELLNLFDSFKFYFFDWIDLKLNTEKNKFFLINIWDFSKDDQFQNNISHKNEKNLVIIKETIKYKNLNLYVKTTSLITNLFKLYELMNLDCLFTIKFDTSTQKFKLRSFPVLHVNLVNFNFKHCDVEKNEFDEIKAFTDVDSLFLSQNKDFFNYLIHETIDLNKDLLSLILHLFKSYHLEKYLRTVMSLLILHYIFSHFKQLMMNKKLRIFVEFRSVINSLEDFMKIENSANYIAFLFIVTLFQFLEDLFNKELSDSSKTDDSNYITIGAIIENNNNKDLLNCSNSFVLQKVKRQLTGENLDVSHLSSFFENTVKRIFLK